MWTPKQVWFYRQVICFSAILEMAPTAIHVCCRIHGNVRSTEAADVYGAAHLAAPRNPHFELRKWPDEVDNVKLTALTACTSVFDHLHKQGSSPADDKRAALDVQLLRDQQHNSGIRVRWVATAQMIADVLTNRVESSYLDHVLQTSQFHIAEQPDIAWVWAEERQNATARRTDHIINHPKLNTCLVNGRCFPTSNIQGFACEHFHARSCRLKHRTHPSPHKAKWTLTRTSQENF